MKKTLKTINSEMKSMKIPYTFDAWNKDLKLPQFIGELTETSSFNEDGLSEYTLILTGYAMKNDVDYLIGVAEQLKSRYRNSRIIAGYGAITFNNVTFIDTNNEELKQIQITLNIKEWSV